jgi:hypothetical protein
MLLFVVLLKKKIPFHHRGQITRLSLKECSGNSSLTLSLAAGAFKFHPYSGRPFKKYKEKR